MDLEMGKVLIIDDEDDLRETLVDLIRSKNLEVKDTESAAQALQLIDDGYQPSLIICDLNMPEMSGEQFIQNLVHRSSPSVVAVLSGYDDQARIIQCMNMVAADFIVKPIDQQAFLDKVYLMLEIFKTRQKASTNPEKARHFENLLRIRQGKLTRSRKAI